MVACPTAARTMFTEIITAPVAAIWAACFVLAVVPPARAGEPHWVAVSAYDYCFFENASRFIALDGGHRATGSIERAKLQRTVTSRDVLSKTNTDVTCYLLLMYTHNVHHDVS